MANALRRRGATVICITDPGPDPDDAKALLLLAMAHKHAHINLAAVIANGGGRPARRAQLARLILDRVGEPAVPVGIGSAGIPIPEQPYECAMRGYDAVSLARLLDGKALLARTLSRASTRSLTMLLISGLRDFADFVTSQPGLVLRKVRTVTIQGGLISNAASPFGYVPDTSQNNAYDPAAAELVYNFCFTHGIRMNVVSRDAVPLLPMQLARSFAVRTESELLRYLANAQFLGLGGLWQKLCAGQLPARCDKAWFFETFCGVDGAEFRRRRLDELDESVDILAHLNGFVKPYDVIAAMTVLPTTSAWFSRAAEVEVNGTMHRLLLGAEHAMDVWSVHNLLRETYHSVALLDTSPANSSRHWTLGVRKALSSQLRAAALSWHAPIPAEAPWQGVRMSRKAERQPRQTQLAVSVLLPARESVRASSSSLSCTARTHAAPAGGRQFLPSLGASAHGPSNNRISSVTSADESAPLSNLLAFAEGAELVEMLHADRLRSEDGTVSFALTAKLLSESVIEARNRQAAMMARMLLVTVLTCTCSLALWLWFAFATPLRRDGGGANTAAVLDAGDAEWAALQADIVVNTARDNIAGLSFCSTSSLIILSLSPTAQQRARMLITGIFGMLMIAGTMVPSILRLTRYVPRIVSDLAQEDDDAPATWLLLSALASMVQVLCNSFACTMCLALMWCMRADEQRLLSALWQVIALVYFGSALSILLIFARYAAYGMFARAPHLAVLAITPVLIYALFGCFAALPHLRRHVQALAAWSSSRTRGILASLAPLLGYGSAEGERDAVELHNEARAAFRGLVLDEVGLDALGAAWIAAKACHSAAAPPTTIPLVAGCISGWCRPSWRARLHVNEPAAIEEALCDGEGISGHSSAIRGDVLQRARAPPVVPLPSGASARAHVDRVKAFDWYVVHHVGDDAHLKLAALRRHCHAFKASRGRPPVAFVDTLCEGRHAQLQPASDAKAPDFALRGVRTRGALRAPTDSGCVHGDVHGGAHGGGVDEDSVTADGRCAPRRWSPALKNAGGDGAGRVGGVASRTAARSLEHMAVRLARSSQLVVLASAPLFERLLFVLEIFVWRITGGGQDMVQVLPIARNELERNALLASVDAFHVMHCQAEAHAEQRRISRAVETAGMAAFNDVVRALFPAVRDELVRMAQAPDVDGLPDGVTVSR